jgi:hypothetical protein
VIKKLGGGAFGEIYKGMAPINLSYLSLSSTASNLCNYIVEKRKTGEHLAAKVVS